MDPETAAAEIDSSLPNDNEITPRLFKRRLWSSFNPWPRQDDDLVGAGLLNLGNTCYLNAVLQCIIHTVPIVEKIRSSYKFHSCGAKDDSEDYFCSLCALKVLIDKSLANSGMFMSPYAFTNNLTKISLDFQLGQQEDAHEFLLCLLDNLHNCCLDPSSKDKPSAMNEDSLVKQVYGGRLISQLRCLECGYCSNTFEPLLDFSLEIADSDTLIDALKSFTKVEEIEETKFTCEGCKAEVLMEKQTKINQAPAVISFHLKRFNHNAFGIEKINKSVEYPLELDLEPFISYPKDELQEQTTYELYAVLVHLGNYFFSGHYNCYVRSSPTTWHLMDDCKVYSVSESDVLAEKAYILFYVKKGVSPWFSSLMDAQRLDNTSPVSVLEPTHYRHSPYSTEEACSSGSQENPERDDVSSSHDVADSSSKENLERCEGVGSSHDVADNFTADLLEIDHYTWSDIINDRDGTFPTSRLESMPMKRSAPDHPIINMSNHQDGTFPTTRPESTPTERPALDHTTINMPNDSFLENEKENRTPRVNMRSKAISPKAAKNIDPSLRRRMRGWPSSRRSILLRSLPPMNKTPAKRSPSIMGGRPLDKKRVKPLFQ